MFFLYGEEACPPSSTPAVLPVHTGEAWRRHVPVCSCRHIRVATPRATSAGHAVEPAGAQTMTAVMGQVVIAQVCVNQELCLALGNLEQIRSEQSQRGGRHE